MTDPAERKKELAHARQLLLEAVLIEYEIQAYKNGKHPQVKR